MSDAALPRAAVLSMQAALRAQGARADPLAVVQAHVAAVRTGDPILMAADYASGARITRGAERVVPAHYFPQAVERLGSSTLLVRVLRREADTTAVQDSARIVMEWELQGDRAHGTRGTDTFTVIGDRIVDQQVVLHTADY